MPLGSGPPPPSASQLPPPNLNAQASKLLEVFKQAKPKDSPQKSAENTNVAGTTHQARLLDLFKQPSPAPVTPTTPPKTGAMPPKADEPKTVNVDPVNGAKTHGRRATLNEITRTLPPATRRPTQPPQISILQRPNAADAKDANPTGAGAHRKSESKPPSSISRSRVDVPKTTKPNSRPGDYHPTTSLPRWQAESTAYDTFANCHVVEREDQIQNEWYTQVFNDHPLTT